MQSDKIVNFGKDFQFNTDKKLGSGAFGIVFEGQRINRLQFDTKQLPDRIAIKVITLSSPTQEDQIRKQIQNYKRLSSPGVVSMYKYELIDYKGDKAFAVAMQLMEGTLQQFLEKEYKGKPIPENKAIEIYREIVKAYKCIYNRSEQKKEHYPNAQDIIHRDIKPANILYKYEGNNLKLKIGDLGTLRNHEQSKTMTKGLLTKKYASPQQMSYRKGVKYTNKADLYATAVILFQLLNGQGNDPIEVLDPVSGLYCVDPDQNKKLNQDATRNVFKELGVSPVLAEFIINCLKKEEEQRLSWKDVFGHKIFQKNLPMKEQTMTNNENKQNKQNKLKITPDTTTYAWKEKDFRQDNTNKNICIFKGGFFPNWLCSTQEFCDGQFVFTIKAHNLSSFQDTKRMEHHFIWIGVMDTNMKGKSYKDTQKNCTYLSVSNQCIYRPNEEQTNIEAIQCSSQHTLSPFPCLIQCHVNCNQSTIKWHYNGKDQAKSNIPNSWKDRRKICAVVRLFNLDDCVEFV